MLTLGLVLTLLLIGAMMGAFSGLLGLGGAIALNPICWYLFGKAGIREPIFVTSATMSVTIFFNALVAARRHHTKNNIKWAWVPWIIAGALVGAMLGPVIVQNINQTLLRKGFGALQVATAFYLLGKNALKDHDEEPVYNRGKLGFFGFCSGLLASSLGIGGGVVTVSLLRVSCKLPMKSAVGISTVVMMFSTGMSSLSWIANGWGQYPLDEGYLGFVFLPVSVTLMATSMVAAWIGAGYVDRVDQKLLQKLLAYVLVISGLNLSFGVSGFIKEMMSM